MSQKIETHGPSTGSYVAVWMVLIASLGLLLLLHTLPAGALTVTATFAIAACNAYLMLTQFMHMSLEPRYVRWLMIGAFLAVVILLVALIPDIVVVYGGTPTP